MTIVLVQATITATRFAIEKRPRLRLIRRSRGFDQYTDQYQKISGWTQWTRQLFVPTENGAKSAGKHPIAGLLRPDASSHAGGHWFESSSLHQKEPDFARNQVLFFLFCNFFVSLQCPGFLPFLIDHRNTTDRKTPASAGVSFFRFHGWFPASRSCLRSAWISAFMVVIRTFSFSSHSSRV